MNLRFTLADYYVLEKTPSGWRELELTIKRNSDNKAIYWSYMSELTFWGDGWDYFKYIINGVGICGRVPVLIEIDRNDSGNWKKMYSGVIDLADCEINFERQTVTGPIKSDAYLNYISQRYNYGVWYFNNVLEVGVQEAFGGTPVENQDVVKYCNLHDVSNGDQPVRAGFYGFCYRVIDALSYHMQYMTDNKVSVVSDFFTKQSFQRGKYEVEFAGDFSPGEVVDISFLDCFGHKHTDSYEINSSVQSDELNEISKLFVRQANFDRFIGNDPVPADDSQKASAVYAYHDGSAFSWSEYEYVPGATWKIKLETLAPITDLVVTRTGGDETVTITQTQELKYGMKNLYMAFNTEIAGSSDGSGIGDKLLTFRELFAMMDARFDLGMQLVDVGSGLFQMRIEPKSYFYNKPQILDAGDVINLTAEPNKDLLIQNLAVGTKGANANYFKGPSGKKQNWSIGGCAVEVTDKNTDGNFDISAVGYQNSNFATFFIVKYPNDVTFFLSTDDTVGKGTEFGDPVLSEIFKIRTINSFPFTIQNDAFEGTLHSYNGGLINYWAVANHLFSLGGTPQVRSTAIVDGTSYVKNTDTAFSRRNYEFDAILSDNEVQMCLLQPTGRVGFRDTAGEQRSKSLSELKWNINTKKAHFKVFG